MENKTNRFLRLLLVIAMVVAILPMTFASAAETDVAKIGEQGYTTLQAAIDACTTGDNVITLLKDCGGNATITQVANKNITIDGAGKTYTGTITINGNNRSTGTETLTFNNVVFKTTNSNSISDGKNKTGVHNVYFVNCTFAGADGYSVNLTQSYNITFDGCTVNMTNSLYQSSSTTSNLDVKNTIIQNCSWAFKVDYAANAVDFDNVKVNNAEVFVCASNYGSTYPIYNFVKCNITADYPILYWGRTTSVKAEFHLDENTKMAMTGNQPLASAGVEQDTEYKNLYRYGTKTAPCVWDAPKVVYVAQIGEQGYESLQAAIDAAQAGQTITMIADIELDDPNMLISQAITLDLNGFDINASGVLFNVSGHLTLKDSSTEGDGTIKVVAGGSKGNATAVNLAQGGCFTMNSGNIYAEKKGVNAGNKTAARGNIVINGGTITTPHEGVDPNDVECPAPIFINKNDKPVDLVITGGTLTGYYVINCDAPNSNISITGGNLVHKGENGFAVDVKADNVNIAITGGTFTSDVSDWVATGYKCEKQTNSVWTVAEFNPVAEVGGKQYESLQAAINAATTGQTITFLTDITENVTVNKNVTIDGAGKTFTGNMALTNRADITIVNVNFDGKGYNGYAIDVKGAYYVTIEDCTAKNYGFGFLQIASDNVATTVKNVTASNMNYGVKVDHSHSVTLENVNFTVNRAGLLNCDNGVREIKIKNSHINIFGTWKKTGVNKTTFVFEGANSVDTFALDPTINEFKLVAGATLTAPNDITATTDVADHKVAYKNGTYEVVPAAIEVIVTVQNATKVEGNANPQFSYTTNVEGVPALNITYTVSGTTINATVAEMDGYAFTVVPGTLTVQKALVLVVAGGQNKYFVDLNEALQHAYSCSSTSVSVRILGNLTVTEPIVIRDNDSVKNSIEMRSDNLSKNFTITATGSEFIQMESGTLYIKSLNINAENDAFYVTGGTVELRSYLTAHVTNVTSQKGNCVYIRGGTVNVYGANLTSNGEYPAIQGNGNYAGNVHIGIWQYSTNNATSKITAPNSDMAIYWPQNGKLTIDKATITGKTALYVKSGTIVINGGTFNGTGAKVAFTHNSNGANATGDAVVIESCKDAAYETPVVSIKGGTFISTNAQGVAVYNCNEDKHVTKFISGGIFSSMPAAEWCVDGKGPKHYNETMWTVGAGILTVDGVWFDTMADAKGYIKGGSEIVLYADVVNEGSFSVGAANKTVTLDLNGHKFTTTTIGVDGHKTLHITDRATGGSVVVTNYTALYPNGYLNVDSDVDFNSKIQFSYHSEATPSTGCLLIDGKKWIGRGHYQQADGIIGTTGGTVTIKNNFQSITFNSGNFYLNETADFAAFAETQNITVNANTTLDLKGNILTTDSIIAFSELVDTAQDKTGGVKVTTDDISWVQKDYMPIYDSKNGYYSLFTYKLNSLGLNLNTDHTAAKFGVDLRFDKLAAYELIKNGDGKHFATLTFKITIQDYSKNCTFSWDTFADWAKKAGEYYTVNPNTDNPYALILTINGLETMDEGDILTVAPIVGSYVPDQESGKPEGIFSTQSADLMVKKENGVVNKYTTPAAVANEDEDGDDEGNSEGTSSGDGDPDAQDQ